MWIATLCLLPALPQAVVEEHVLSSAVPEAGAQFGQSLSIDGDRLAVGATRYPEPGGVQAGAVFVMEKDAAGNWSQTALLRSADPAPAVTDWGYSVALDGDRLLVGEPFDQTGVFPEGRATLFERQADGTWLQTAELVDPQPGPTARLGQATDLRRDLAAVGYRANEGSGVFDLGRVLLFERQGDGSWSNVFTVGPSPFAEADREFGASVALGEGFLFVGAPRAFVVGTTPGRVEVWERLGNVWTTRPPLTTPGAVPDDRFGASLACDGTRLVVGSPSDDDGQIDVGAAYVFELSGGTWSEVAKLVPAGAPTGAHSGTSVSLSGDRVLVGAPDWDGPGDRSGAAVLFERRSDGTWHEVVRFEASEAGGIDIGGTSVALSDGDAAWGAPWFHSPTTGPGHVYTASLGGLFRGAATVSLSAGGPEPAGIQPLSLRAGEAHANEIFVFLASRTGMSPGVTLASGIVIPLVFDAFTTATLTGGGVVMPRAGFLDGAGRAEAAVVVPSGLDPALAGASVYHAYVTIGPAPTFTLTSASNAVRLLAVP